MSYTTNIDNIDIEKILAESKRTRMGLEGSSYVPGQSTYQTTTVVESKDYQPGSYSYQGYTPSTNQVSSYQVSSYQPPKEEVYQVSSYQPPKEEVYQVSSYQPPKEEVRFSYHQPAPETSYQYTTIQGGAERTEDVKRAGVQSSVRVVGGGSTPNGRLNIIMLGAEIERLLELGRDVDYRYNQLNIEIITIRETLNVKEREVIDLRQRDNSGELRRILEDKERELLLLRSNMGNEVPVNPDIENNRKRLKNLEFEHADLSKKASTLHTEVNKILAELGKGRQARSDANSKKQSTAWCC